MENQEIELIELSDVELEAVSGGADCPNGKPNNSHGGKEPCKEF